MSVGEKSWLNVTAPVVAIVQSGIPLVLDSYEPHAEAMVETNAWKKRGIAFRTLFYLEKKSYQDITEQTGYSLLKVKSHIQNGKRNLKIMLERLQHNEQ